MIIMIIATTTTQELTPERFRREYAAKKPVVVTGAWPEEGWRPEPGGHPEGVGNG